MVEDEAANSKGSPPTKTDWACIISNYAQMSKNHKSIFIGELMEREKFWLRIKKWQNMHRKLEEHKRKKVIKRLDKQVRDKKLELEEKKKEYANEEEKRKRVDEKLEKMLREKREELERKRIGIFEKY